MILKRSKLGDVCKIQSGNSIPAKEKDELFRNAKEGLPYVATKDINFTGSINFQNGIRIPSKFYNRFKLSKKDSVLICAEGGSAGRKIAYSNKDCHFVNKLFSIKPKDEIYVKYIYYYTLGDEFQKNFKKSMRGLIGGVSLSKIKSFQITYPCLTVQQDIITKLDAVFAEIDKIKLSIKYKTELSKRLFIKYLDSTFQNSKFKSIKIGDIIGVHSGGTPSTTNKNYWNGAIPWYSSRELNDYRTKDSVKKITKLALENSNAKIFPKNTLLIGIYDTAAMKMSILDQDGTFNQAIVGIPPNLKFETEYLFFALNHLKDKILLERRGVRQMNLSLAKIKNINLPQPTLEEQKNIINCCNRTKEQTKNLEKILVKKSHLLNSLKKSILNQKLNNKVA